MKKFITVVIALLYSFIGVNMVFAAPDTWTQKANLTKNRSFAVGFSIGEKGYIGTGYASTESKDFWEYDPTTNVWTQKADFGGSARYAAVGFSIRSKGYIGLGRVGGSAENFKDFWEYDPTTNIWTKKANFGAEGIICAVGFSIGNKGYVGTGDIKGYGSTKGFWEYDPTTNIWTQKADFGGVARMEATGFSIGSKGYIGTGMNFINNWVYYKDFWEYDPATDKWTQKADFGGVARNTAVGFSIGSKGYIGVGGDNGINGTVANGARGPYYYKDFWEYEPDTDKWTQRADFGGAARKYAVGYSIGGKGYIGTGSANSSGSLKDFWEYEPADTTPDQFIFNYETGVDLNTVVTSNTITVSGINAAAPITIEGGTYSINGGAYTSADGTVNNGDTVTVQQTSSGGYSTTTVATLTIGGVSDTFSVITQVESIISLNPVADKTTLWPPNLKMVKVTIQANASDTAGGPVKLTAKVSCNELALRGIDWTVPVINQKTGVISLSLRAMRWGIRTDRIYSITITATGTEGNSATKTITVTVPHDQRDGLKSSRR